ncbi:MAG: type II toxin-antitoxin system RnlB family antitoxin [Lactococcus petauri]
MNAIMIKTNSEFPYVIVGTSYLHPISDIYQFVSELTEKNYVGDILIDSLLSNGFSSNRYLKIFFDGKKFIENNVHLVSGVSREIDNKIYGYFCENPEVVETNEILPNSQKYLLTNGKLIK